MSLQIVQKSSLSWSLGDTKFVAISFQVMLSTSTIRNHLDRFFLAWGGDSWVTMRIDVVLFTQRGSNHSPIMLLRLFAGLTRKKTFSNFGTLLRSGQPHAKSVCHGGH